MSKVTRNRARRRHLESATAERRKVMHAKQLVAEWIKVPTSGEVIAAIRRK